MKYIKKYQTTAEALADEREKPWLIHINETDKCGVPLPEPCTIDVVFTINEDNDWLFIDDNIPNHIVFFSLYGDDVKYIKTSDERIKRYSGYANSETIVEEVESKEGIYSLALDFDIFGIKIGEGKTIADYYGDYTISLTLKSTKINHFLSDEIEYTKIKYISMPCCITSIETLGSKTPDKYIQENKEVYGYGIPQSTLEEVEWYNERVERGWLYHAINKVTIGGCCTHIYNSAAISAKNIIIKKDVIAFDEYSFMISSTPNEITYEGTIAEWNAIQKDELAFFTEEDTQINVQIKCIDGNTTVVAIPVE